jgi:hypothetical protein
VGQVFSLGNATRCAQTSISGGKKPDPPPHVVPVRDTKGKEEKKEISKESSELEGQRNRDQYQQLTEKEQPRQSSPEKSEHLKKPNRQQAISAQSGVEGTGVLFCREKDV